MILAGLAFLGAGGFLFLNEMNALPDDLFSFSLPLLSAQKVTLKFSEILNHTFLQKKDLVLKDSSPSPEPILFTPAVLMSTNVEAPPPLLRPEFDQMIDFSKPPRHPPLISALTPPGYKNYQRHDFPSEITRD